MVLCIIIHMIYIFPLLGRSHNQEHVFFLLVLPVAHEPHGFQASPSTKGKRKGKGKSQRHQQFGGCSRSRLCPRGQRPLRQSGWHGRGDPYTAPAPPNASDHKGLPDFNLTRHRISRHWNRFLYLRIHKQTNKQKRTLQWAIAVGSTPGSSEDE